MYGRHFESMYQGSMIGAGAIVFAVMGYVISKRRKDLVEINPTLLAFTLGETEEVVNGAIAKLCAPDPKSRSKLEEGRRLIKEGEYLFRVVNADEYDRVANELERLSKDRDRKARQRQAEALGASDKIAFEKSLDRITKRLAELKDSDMEPYVSERKELKVERQRILGLLGLKA